MKTILLFTLLFFTGMSSFAQSDSILKFIFVPHPRSEDKVHQSVLPEIEKIDFSKYDMTLLGGDITYYTSINRTSMDYCDKLFDLGNPNTLWTMGNHDLNNPALVAEYTGRSRFYSYYRDSITFVVLDTEANANGFKSSYISGNQLNMLATICDTISLSRYLVVLHGRLLWMIGNDDFKTRIDSVAESTRQLDTTNFYQLVYPQLQIAKSRGIKVICLGGDKSRINIEYFAEDSITFYTSTMAPEYADSVNDVLVFQYNKVQNTMSREFIPLDKVEKNKPISDFISHEKPIFPTLSVIQEPNSREIRIQCYSEYIGPTRIDIYSVKGELCRSVSLKSSESGSFYVDYNGIYIIRAINGNTLERGKYFLFGKME